MNGHFVISLDFELMWGVREKKTIESYGKNILGVHTAIPLLLDVFSKFNIKSTFSIVGLLFFEDKETMLNNLPAILPNYQNTNLSPYLDYIHSIGKNSSEDKYHFAPELIRLIQKYPEHEIGSHTFSHYFCLEEGQSVDAFREDLKFAQICAKKYGLKLTSLVFPRNQFNDEYLTICKENGIICYRGNEHSWIYEARAREKETLLRRGFRLIDTYFNISGHNCYSENLLKNNCIIDIPSSRFLRPFYTNLKYLDFLRLHRITSGMTYAAKNNLIYHLWWHPHNFGVDQEENFKFLEKILIHYSFLNKKYGFDSITMTELSTKLLILNK
jgi:Polysaccharide deacetylase